MTRNEMKQILRIRSVWDFKRRRGDYRLPSGDRLSDYLLGLLREQMDLDDLVLTEDGGFYAGVYMGDFWKVFVPFQKDTTISLDREDVLLRGFIHELIS